jgi:hypothetical protein
MTCSTLSAIIASAEKARYGRKPAWRSAEKGVRAIYLKCPGRECCSALIISGKLL